MSERIFNWLAKNLEDVFAMLEILELSEDINEAELRRRMMRSVGKDFGKSQFNDFLSVSNGLGLVDVDKKGNYKNIKTSDFGKQTIKPITKNMMDFKIELRRSFDAKK